MLRPTGQPPAMTTASVRVNRVADSHKAAYTSYPQRELKRKPAATKKAAKKKPVRKKAAKKKPVVKKVARKMAPASKKAVAAS